MDAGDQPACLGVSSCTGSEFGTNASGVSRAYDICTMMTDKTMRWQRRAPGLAPGRPTQETAVKLLGDRTPLQWPQQYATTNDNHGGKEARMEQFFSTGEPAKLHALALRIVLGGRSHKMCLSSEATSHRGCFVPRQLIEKTPLTQER